MKVVLKNHFINLCMHNYMCCLCNCMFEEYNLLLFFLYIFGEKHIKKSQNRKMPPPLSPLSIGNYFFFFNCGMNRPGI